MALVNVFVMGKLSDVYKVHLPTSKDLRLKRQEQVVLIKTGTLACCRPGLKVRGLGGSAPSSGAVGGRLREGIREMGKW